MHIVSTSQHNPKDSPTTETSTRGRPTVQSFPEPIPDTLENVALSVFNPPPKKDQEWEYLKRGEYIPNEGITQNSLTTVSVTSSEGNRNENKF